MAELYGVRIPTGS